MSLKSILKPTKEKIVIDALISILLIALSVSLPSLSIQSIFLQMNFFEKIFNTLIGLIITLLIYYPLTAGLLHIYRIITKERHPYRKSEKINKFDISWAILFIIILNPISISAIYSTAVYINNKIIQEPCGLEIIRVTDNSEAGKAGIKQKEIISRINNQPVKSKDDLLRIMKNEQPGKYAMVVTEREDYRVKITQDPVTKKNVLGIVVKEKYCKRIPK